MELATPALDFLAFVQGRAETPGYEGWLDERDLTSIGQIIVSQDERRARSQLLRIQARLTDRAFLEPADLARLEAITSTSKPRRQSSLGRDMWNALSFAGRSAIIGCLAAGLVLGLVFGIIVPWARSNAAGAPPAGTAPQVPPAAQAPAPGYSDLQLLKQNWGPWQQLTPSDSAPQTGAPGLLLLQQGAYLVSEKWTVSPQARGWVQDITGNVGTVNVHGDYIDFTDAEGNPGIVRVDQPFVESGNPAVVLRIDAAGTVYQMSQAQAIAVRSR